jgi:hypothetical protein
MIVPTITIEARMLSIEMYAADEAVPAPPTAVSMAAAGSTYCAIAAEGPNAKTAVTAPVARTTGAFTTRTTARKAEVTYEKILMVLPFHNKPATG